MQVNSLSSVQALVADARLMEIAGISFGEEQTYRLQKSIQVIIRINSLCIIKIIRI